MHDSGVKMKKNLEGLEMHFYFIFLLNCHIFRTLCHAQHQI